MFPQGHGGLGLTAWIAWMKTTIKTSPIPWYCARRGDAWSRGSSACSGKPRGTWRTPLYLALHACGGSVRADHHFPHTRGTFMETPLKPIGGSSEPPIPIVEGTVSGPTTQGSPIPMQVDPPHGGNAASPAPKEAKRPGRRNRCGAERRRRRKVRLAREDTAETAGLPQQSQPSDSPRREGSVTQSRPLAAGSAPKGAPSSKTGPSSSTKMKTTSGPKPPRESASKRQRTPGSTPDAARASKRPRSGPSRRWQAGYAQVTSEERSLQVVIGREGQPNASFTEDQLLDFLDAVREAITQSPTGSDTPLQFSSTRLWRGQLLVTAANQASKDWLLGNLKNIRPWSDASLVVLDPALMRLHKALVWVPARKPPSNEGTLRSLERQNPGLSCSQWKIWKRSVEPQGVNLIVGMDEKSISTLKGLNFQPFFSATRAHVTMATRRTGGGGGTAKADTLTAPPTALCRAREPERDPGGHSDEAEEGGS